MGEGIMTRLFGTDGVRGRVNQHPLTPELCLRLGLALGGWARADAATKPRAVIGWDTRSSADMVVTSLSSGLLGAGVDVEWLGVLPTPAVAAIARESDACIGLVVSASHNPFFDNGIKVFDGSGFKLSDKAEHAIEKEVLVKAPFADLVGAEDVGVLHQSGPAVGLSAPEHSYVERLVSTVGENALAGLKIVLDCAHGAGYRVGPEVLRQLGARVSTLGAQPDGRNINDGVGATAPSQLAEAVVTQEADLGIALDGDGDRVILVDEAGQVLDGDVVLATLAVAFKLSGTLAKDLVVATIMSNLGLEVVLKAAGIRLERTRVGDRYVVEQMRKTGAVLGGEQSGHIVSLSHSTTGDGLLAGALVAARCRADGVPLSHLAGSFPRFPQVLINVRVRVKPALDSLPHVSNVIATVGRELAEEGRVVVRYSGTEPVARVMVEGPTQEIVRACAERIAEAFRQEIGAPIE